MSYSSADIAHKQNHGDIDSNAQSGVTTAIVTSAFNMVKARIQASGLTPPATSDILAEAENFYINAKMVWKGRMMGHLPTGGNASIISNDNVNTSFAMFIKLGNELVDEYIKYASTNVQPSTSTGVSRADYTFKDMKLDQRAISEPVDIKGKSLASDQRS